ncbi:MAG: hypothetical protein NTX49_07100 [Chlamydiae bacterium]|nr:hypothetical protein [Chlamydiota bacterium]
MAAPIDVSNLSPLYLRFFTEGDPRDEYTQMISLSDKVNTTIQGFFANLAFTTPYRLVCNLNDVNLEKTWSENQVTKDATPDYPAGLIFVTAIRAEALDPNTVMLPDLAARLSTIPG